MLREPPEVPDGRLGSECREVCIGSEADPEIMSVPRFAWPSRGPPGSWARGSCPRSSRRGTGSTAEHAGRRRRAPTDVEWDPARGRLDPRALEGVDAVVNLAGESIAARRWSGSVKERIRRSRVEGTRLLGRDARAPRARPAGRSSRRPPSGTTATGATSRSPRRARPGLGLPRRRLPRMGGGGGPRAGGGHPRRPSAARLVLARQGGALPRMALPFRLGVGGVVGSGRQYWSWIEAGRPRAGIELCLGLDGLAGPVNAAAPVPVTNREFTRAWARFSAGRRSCRCRPRGPAPSRRDGAGVAPRERARAAAPARAGRIPLPPPGPGSRAPSRALE